MDQNVDMSERVRYRYPDRSHIDLFGLKKAQKEIYLHQPRFFA